MRGLICWDMDETLGWFRPIGDVLVDEATRPRWRRLMDGWLGRAPAPPPPIRVREGIADVLRDLRRAGFAQAVTTGGLPDYARRALADAGLATLVDGVFARDVIWDGWGKRYQPVLERFGVEPERTIIVGDDWKKDRGSDHPGMVLVCQPDGWQQPASLLAPVIEGLAGGGSFSEGFERLFAAAAPGVVGRRAQLGGVSAIVSRWGNEAKGDLTPVVSDLTRAS